MLRLSVDPREPDPDAVRQAARALLDGGIVSYPTDTLYALGVDPRRDDCVQKLFGAKGREGAAAIALIAADAEQAGQAGPFGDVERKLARAFWPGPLTIVVPAAATMSRLLSGDLRTLGVRVPAHAAARSLAHACGTCITSTSANVSGRPASVTADEVAAVLSERIDVLLDAGPVPGGPASTIVEVVGGRLTLHRSGAVAWDRVLRSIE
jgi:L-threonylcarbamoyladenylate synthase